MLLHLHIFVHFRRRHTLFSKRTAQLKMLQPSSICTFSYIFGIDISVIRNRGKHILDIDIIYFPKELSSD